MTDALVDPLDPGAAGDLDGLCADIDWVDPMAARAARDHLDAQVGRLAALHVWLAGTQRAFPVRVPARARCVVVGSAPAPVESICAAADVGLRAIPIEPGWSVGEALRAGAAAADDEVDAGTDLAVVAEPGAAPELAVLVSVLTGTEPVALLPRGALATDSADWIRRAEFLRDTRRRIAHLRERPDDLLAALAHPPLAVTAGFVARATTRRTPLVLDGTGALAAALACAATQPRAAAWWQAADTSPDAVHTTAAVALELDPILGLRTSTGDGTAGVLSLPVIRAAATLGSAA